MARHQADFEVISALRRENAALTQSIIEKDKVAAEMTALKTEVAAMRAEMAAMRVAMVAMKASFDALVIELVD